MKAMNGILRDRSLKAVDAAFSFWRKEYRLFKKATCEIC
jgi:hypothetical protein